MRKGLEIKNEHGATLFDASQTAGVDCADDAKNDNLDSSEQESDDEN